MVNVREVIVPSRGFVLLSADYSQLELRILAHLCGDASLIATLNGETDAFKSIAATWKGRLAEEVRSKLFLTYVFVVQEINLSSFRLRIRSARRRSASATASSTGWARGRWEATWASTGTTPRPSSTRSSRRFPEYPSTATPSCPPAGL